MKVTALCIYPVKSCRGVSLPESVVTDYGLAGDREYVITTPEGHFITQRQIPRMATLSPDIQDSRLFLTAPDTGTLELSSLSGESCEVTVWKDRVVAQDLGDQAAEFVTTYLGTFKGQGLRVRRFLREHSRWVNEQYTDRRVPYGFADALPYLVVSDASLRDLNERLREKGHPHVPMNRFRPNIVLGESTPYQEDATAEIVIGRLISLRLAKACARCTITTVNQDTGEEEGVEPLATLAQFRKAERGVMFGQNAYLTQGRGERIRVGDSVLTARQN